MEWSEEVIGRLRVLWGEGHSTAEIGRRLGVSKNAVVGKAHRLDLPARPSPIRRDGSGATPRVRAPRRVAGPTLPPLSSTHGATHAAMVTRPVPVAPRPAPVPAEPRAEAFAAPPAPVAVAPVPRPQPAPRPFARTVACCWPIGEPGTKSFRFCDADATPGKPYCQEHAQLAYVRVRDRREDAA
ncbi:MAG: GcrA cell cycle regulator [Proteobacteria bacterium]|nr:GcrA cell cycle regulator [Pseudomonadota bacterium]